MDVPSLMSIHTNILLCKHGLPFWSICSWYTYCCKQLSYLYMYFSALPCPLLFLSFWRIYCISMPCKHPMSICCTLAAKLFCSYFYIVTFFVHAPAKFFFSSQLLPPLKSLSVLDGSFCMASQNIMQYLFSRLNVSCLFTSIYQLERYLWESISMNMIIHIPR